MVRKSKKKVTVIFYRSNRRCIYCKNVYDTISVLPSIRMLIVDSVA